MNRARSVFFDVAAVILFVFAAFNALAIFSSVAALDALDPILRLSNRSTLWLYGGAELLCSVYLFVGKNASMKLFWLASLTANLGIYRAGLWHGGSSNFDDCLGNYVEWFLIPPHTMAIGADVLIGFLLAGSCGFLAVGWLKSKKPKTEPSGLVAQPSP